MEMGLGSGQIPHGQRTDVLHRQRRIVMLGTGTRGLIAIGPRGIGIDASKALATGEERVEIGHIGTRLLGRQDLTRRRVRLAVAIGPLARGMLKSPEAGQPIR